MSKNYSKKFLKKYYKQLKLVKEYIEKYKNITDDEIKEKIHSQKKEEKAAISYIIFKNEMNITLHDVQIIAVLALLDNKFIDVKTGEGKTFIVAAYILIGDKPIHVSTVNEYLAIYAVKELHDMFEKFGISVSTLTHAQIEADLSSDILSKFDVVYSTPANYCFAYLGLRSTRNPTKINYNTAILDEADFVLIDNATSEHNLSSVEPDDPTQVDNIFECAQEIKKIIKEANVININHDEATHWNQFKDPGEGYYENSIFFNHALNFAQPTDDLLQRLTDKCSEYNISVSESAAIVSGIITATYAFEEWIDYVKINNEIVLVDKHSGRLQFGATLQFYLKLGLSIKEEIKSIGDGYNCGTISNQVYFNKYKNVLGMSGSLIQVSDELLDLFGSETVEIPKNKKSEIVKQMIYCPDLKCKIEKLKEIINKEISENNAVLVICKNDKISNLLNSELKHEFNINLFNNSKGYDMEDKIVSEAGKSRAITISTLLMGRGVDIMPENKSQLVIIMFEEFGCNRTSMQIAGRTGRQGRDGKVYTLISPDDTIFEYIYEYERQRITDKNFDKYVQTAINTIHGQESSQRKQAYYNSKIIDLVLDKYYNSIPTQEYDVLFFEYIDSLKLEQKLRTGIPNQSLTNESPNSQYIEMLKKAYNKINNLKYTGGF